MQGAPLSMVVLQVVKHTPTWVWGLLAALVAVGIWQMRDQVANRVRVLILPVALGAWSLWSSLATFGLELQVFVAWALGMAVMIGLATRVDWPRKVEFLPERNAFRVGGSVVPLLAMLGVFAVRYVVTVTMILQPQWRGHVAVGITGGLVYGLLAGIFAMRARRILSHGAGQARLAAA